MENRALLNSPVVRCRTPLKRLGLSRKRKSNEFQSNLSNKIKARGEPFPISPIQNDEKIHSEGEGKLADSERINSEEEIVESFDESIDYEKENSEIQKRIENKEKLLKVLEKRHSKIVALEELISVWKTGCKNAYLYLVRLIEEKQIENFNCKNWLQKLGIWDIMIENFEEDSEISLSDGSQ